MDAVEPGLIRQHAESVWLPLVGKVAVQIEAAL
jgi:hypothetical protein